MSLKEYKLKRSFHKTKEPTGKKIETQGAKMFVVQKHHASHLHYDFRLELDGVLKSWAIPKGPSLNPKVKRLAIEVEDHPIDYANFEGEIPQGEYGGGHVIVWDAGEWIPPKNVEEQLKKGHLEFELHGEKLGGEWMLLRTRIPGGKNNSWLLIKRDDESASTKDVTKNNKSVLSGVSLEELEKKMPKDSSRPFRKTKFLSFTDLKGPELATLSVIPPDGDKWIHEIKYDGYRTLCFKNKKDTKLLTRSGLDWSDKYSEIKQECQSLNVESIVFDGEIVWLDEKGKSRFEGLQKSLEDHQSDDLVYYVFDLLYLNGYDTRQLPLTDRKKLLKEVLGNSDSEKILFSEHWDESGKSVFENACENNLEGIISKNGESTYLSGRNKNWLKIKCTNIQEFVIGGYTLQKNINELGALLLGAYNSEGKLQYVGKVGTGFNAQTSKKLLQKLKKMKSKQSPFEEKTPLSKNNIWVKPNIVGNIEFGAWTGDKILRHAAFKGLREDKKAHDVNLEEREILTSELTNPDKVLYPKIKITKQELSDYYNATKKWIMPHLTGRPLALVRCPNGIGKSCFFQKHIDEESKGILRKKVDPKLKNTKEEVIYINSSYGLQQLVQLNTLEIHTRGCMIDKIDYPDQIVFDFDPGPDVSFDEVKEAALELKKTLDKLKLKSFVKVSGGKGLHVHVPILPEYNWEQVKGFSKSICDLMVNKYPEKFTTNMSKTKRRGKIFLDYLRNGYGATAIAPYSVRANKYAAVALPISWGEMKKNKNAHSYTLKNVPALLAKRKDPWIEFSKLKQKIKLLDQYNSKHVS